MMCLTSFRFQDPLELPLENSRTSSLASFEECESSFARAVKLFQLTIWGVLFSGSLSHASLNGNLLIELVNISVGIRLFRRRAIVFA